MTQKKTKTDMPGTIAGSGEIRVLAPTPTFSSPLGMSETHNEKVGVGAWCST